jgi:probable rRNA maturation factor
MAVLVSGTVSARGVDRRTLARKAKAALEALGLGDSELSVSLVRDDEIRELNRRYRDEDHATDVLAFALREGEFGCVGEALGDVVISLDTARRQAREHRGTLPDEVERLLVHGILHLAGYDHEISPREERRMQRKERDVRTRLRRASAR